MRRRGSLPLLPMLALCLALHGAAAANASTPTLFHSPADDGVNPGTPPILPGSPTETLFLYIDAGPFASGIGVPCVDGDGDELCAWEFGLQVTGPASVLGFVPDPAQDVVWNSAPGAFNATGGVATVGELGPIRIGELQLSVTGSGWTALVVEGTAVDAAFAIAAVQTGVISMPEPSIPLQLLGGGVTLWLLARYRRSSP